MTASREPSDDDLALLSKDGNLTAFNSLVERYQGPIFAFCTRVLRDAGAGEDATQESFIAAYRAIGRFHGGSFRAWLFRIAANQCRDELRRRRRRPVSSLQAMGHDHETEFDPPDPALLPEDELMARVVSPALERALAALPVEQRELVLMIDLNDMTYHEAARATGASLGTVKSRLFRARESLRATLGSISGGKAELSPGEGRLEK